MIIGKLNSKCTYSIFSGSKSPVTILYDTIWKLITIIDINFLSAILCYPDIYKLLIKEYTVFLNRYFSCTLCIVILSTINYTVCSLLRGILYITLRLCCINPECLIFLIILQADNCLIVCCVYYLNLDIDCIEISC